MNHNNKYFINIYFQMKKNFFLCNNNILLELVMEITNDFKLINNYTVFVSMVFECTKKILTTNIYRKKNNQTKCKKKTFLLPKNF